MNPQNSRQDASYLRQFVPRNEYQQPQRGNNHTINTFYTRDTNTNNSRRPRRTIQTIFVETDGSYDPSNVPMTPSLAAMTPRSRSVTIGQILLARALVSEVIGDRDCTPLSHKEVEAASTPRVFLSSDEEYASSPNTVSKLPRSPPIAPMSTPSPRIAAPSPNSARKLSKEDFQALVNARVKKSISERNAPTRVESEKNTPAPKKASNRFNTVYMTPGGQTIAFKNTGKNTPPTPKFGGESTKKAADVEWSAYEAVHGPVHVSPEIRPHTWRVTPAHCTNHSQPLWSEALPHPPPITIMPFESFKLGQPHASAYAHDDLKFGNGF